MSECRILQLLNEPWHFSDKLDSNGLDSLKNQLKDIYDKLKRVENRFTARSNTSAVSSTLPELVVQRLDDEQIWQQLELQNGEKLNKIKRKTDEITRKFEGNFEAIFRKNVKKSSSVNKNLVIKLKNDGEAMVGIDGEDYPEHFFQVEDENEEDDEDEDDENEDGQENQPIKENFFNLKEMDTFLDEQDEREMRRMDGKGGKTEDDEDLDLAEDEDQGQSEDDIDGSKNYKYKDFFVANARTKVGKKKVHFDDPLDENEEEESYIEEHNIDASGSGNFEDDEENIDSKPKSTFEIRQEKLKEKIEDLEQRNLGEKPWQQVGEIWAKNRPENSLLQEYVEFDHMTRLAPVVTQITTQKLEDVVKQRIKDKAWDDVERKVKPVNEPRTYKTDLILDQQKSKLSLSQIYEQEYLKHHQEEREEVKDQKHEEIKKLMRVLFVKLDALTNYHYTPKLPQNEIKVVNNTKSITVEEVAPVTVNDTDLLAPEEVKPKSKALPKATEERTKTDKLRDLRTKKHLAKAKAKKSEEKEKRSKVPKDKLKMLQKLGKIHKVAENASNKTKSRKHQGDKQSSDQDAKRRKVF